MLVYYQIKSFDLSRGRLVGESFIPDACSVISYRLPSGRLVDGVFPSVFRCVLWEWNDAPKCTRMQVSYEDNI